jgi:hypothetical protein
MPWLISAVEPLGIKIEARPPMLDYDQSRFVTVHVPETALFGTGAALEPAVVNLLGKRLAEQRKEPTA